MILSSVNINRVRVARNAMHCRFEILLCDSRPESRLQAAGEEALDEIARIETQISAYDPESDFYHANADADTFPVRVQAETWNLMRRAAYITQATQGAFDMTVTPLLYLWRDNAVQGIVPDESEIAAVLKLVGMPNVQLHDDFSVTFATPGVRLDPGAIGKGYAIDRAAGILREIGIRSALLHGGTSTVCAIGTSPNDERGWRVSVQHPQIPDAHIADIFLRDNALSVSAMHGRTFYAEQSGIRFGHVLDPRTGRPVETTLAAAVVSSSALDTDALSTALLVLGYEGFPILRDGFPDAALLTATQNGGEPLSIDKTDTLLAQWHESTEGQDYS